MTNIILFQFEQCDIRFVGTAENPEWVAADICKVLGLSNPSETLKNFSGSQKGISNTDDGSLTGVQVLTVTESGLYRLIFKSRKPIAEKFQNWICDEVLPTIRKTGSYSIEQKPQLSRMQILEMAIEAERELVALKAQVEADEPATALGQALINSSDPKNIRIGDFAKILGDVGQNRYFDELRACEIIALTSPLPYQRYIDAGYFRVTQVPGKGAASNRWFPVALITPKGQAYLAKRHSKHIRRETIRDAIECQVSAMV